MDFYEIVKIACRPYDTPGDRTNELQTPTGMNHTAVNIPSQKIYRRLFSFTDDKVNKGLLTYGAGVVSTLVSAVFAVPISMSALVSFLTLVTNFL